MPDHGEARVDAPLDPRGASGESPRAAALVGSALIAIGALLFVATALALFWLLGEP